MQQNKSLRKKLSLKHDATTITQYYFKKLLND